MDPIPDWLYSRASSLRLQSKRKPAEVIKAYEDYIAASEPDARKVPEAFYCLALEYNELNNMEKAEEFLKKAIESESPPLRLPSFGPVEDDFPPKFLLKKMKMSTGIQNQGNQAVQNAKAEEVCQNCGRGGGGRGGGLGEEVLLQCSRCKKVKYCNTDCQKENWKIHKKNCKE